MQPLLTFEIAIGVLIGILSSLTTLFIFHVVMSPKIYWSSKIKVIWLKKSKRLSYSIKFVRSGHSDLIDNRTTCRLTIKDVNKTGSNLSNKFEIPCTFSSPLIISKDSFIVHLKLHEANVFDCYQFEYFKKNLKIHRPEYGLRLEDFFMSYDTVSIRVSIVGHDRKTGIKKIYQSPKYKFHCIRNGKWGSGIDLIVNSESSYA